jgi:hypothetical protein
VGSRNVIQKRESPSLQAPHAGEPNDGTLVLGPRSRRNIYLVAEFSYTYAGAREAALSINKRGSPYSFYVYAWPPWHGSMAAPQLMARKGTPNGTPLGSQLRASLSTPLRSDWALSTCGGKMSATPKSQRTCCKSNHRSVRCSVSCDWRREYYANECLRSHVISI